MELSVGESETLYHNFLLADEIASIRAVIRDQIPEPKIIQALAAAGNNPNRALNLLLDLPDLATSDPKPVKHEVLPELSIKPKNDDLSSLEAKIVVKKEEQEMGMERDSILAPRTVVKKEEEAVFDNSSLLESKSFVKMDDADRFAIVKKEEAVEEHDKVLAQSHYAPCLNPRPIRAIRLPTVTDRRVQLASEPDLAELGEFPEEPDWFLVGKTYVFGLSTCHGRKKIDASEIVYFNFPKNDGKRQFGRRWVSAKTAAATSQIVRFSTKRSGEVC